MISSGSDLSFAAGADSAERLIAECMEESTIIAVHDIGLDPLRSNALSAKVDALLPQCTNSFQDFSSQGFIVTEGTVGASAEISDEAVIVTASYPVTLEKAGKRFEYKDHRFTLRRTVVRDIKLSEDTIIESEDGSLVLRIPAGVRAYLNGNPVDQVGIKLIDKHFAELQNSVVPGMVAFDGVPHGVKFSGPVELTIFYDDDDIHPFYSEEDMRIGYYDPEVDLWWGLDTQVDAVNNMLKIRTDHFSIYDAVVNCDKRETKEWTTPVLVRNDAMPCDDWHDETLETSPSIPAALWTAVDPHTKGYGIGDIFLPDKAAEYIVQEGPVNAKSDLDAGGDNCRECEECEYDTSPSAAGGEGVKYCIGGCGDDDSSSCGGESCAPVEGFSYVCDKIYYYTVPQIFATTTYNIELAGRGDTCIPLLSGQGSTTDEANAAFQGALEGGGKGNDHYSISPTCATAGSGECMIIGAAEGVGDPSFTLEGDTPVLSFTVRGNNIAPSACFESAVRISLKGIGLSEGFYRCETPGELNFIKGRCMRCSDANIWTESTECAGQCVPSTRGMVMEQDGCKICTESGWTPTKQSDCARCDNPFADSTLPRCIGTGTLPEECGAKYSRVGATTASCVESCDCSGNYMGYPLGIVNTGGNDCPNPNAPVCCRCQATDSSACEASLFGMDASCTTESSCTEKSGTVIGTGPQFCPSVAAPACCQTQPLETPCSDGRYDTQWAHADCTDECLCEGSDGGVPMGEVGMDPDDCPDPAKPICCRCMGERAEGICPEESSTEYGKIPETKVGDSSTSSTGYICTCSQIGEAADFVCQRGGDGKASDLPCRSSCTDPDGCICKCDGTPEFIPLGGSCAECPSQVHDTYGTIPSASVGQTVSVGPYQCTCQESGSFDCSCEHCSVPGECLEDKTYCDANNCVIQKDICGCEACDQPGSCYEGLYCTVNNCLAYNDGKCCEPCDDPGACHGSRYCNADGCLVPKSICSCEECDAPNTCIGGRICDQYGCFTSGSCDCMPCSQKGQCVGDDFCDQQGCLVESDTCHITCTSGSGCIGLNPGATCGQGQVCRQTSGTDCECQYFDWQSCSSTGLGPCADQAVDHPCTTADGKPGSCQISNHEYGICSCQPETQCVDCIPADQCAVEDAQAGGCGPGTVCCSKRKISSCTGEWQCVSSCPGSCTVVGQEMHVDCPGGIFAGICCNTACMQEVTTCPSTHECVSSCPGACTISGDVQRDCVNGICCDSACLQEASTCPSGYQCKPTCSQECLVEGDATRDCGTGLCCNTLCPGDGLA